MKTYNIHAAKTHLSKLIEEVDKGEEVIIAKGGNPVAVLKPYIPKNRKGGQWKNKITIPDNFDDPIPEIENLFSQD
ncbi:MAG: type II toxin-antitoxin system Phd/YefM family antitoxin [Cyclobacteriaceae bacterium]